MADLHLLVLTTVPDRATAERIASTLIDEQLGGCVTLVPGVVSMYRWEGEMKQVEEVQLIIKTRADCYPRLEQRLGALHPYEVPEILALAVHTGAHNYFRWLDENLK